MTLDGFGSGPEAYCQLYDGRMQRLTYVPSVR
jgi:hypothetical protein